MGFHNALNACFTLHQLNHSHWAQIHENKYPVALAEDGIPTGARRRPSSRPARTWPRRPPPEGDLMANPGVV